MSAPEQINILLNHSSPVLQAGLLALLARHRDFDCSERDEPAPVHRPQALPDVVVADHGRGVAWVNALGSVANRGAGPCVLVVTHSDRECDIRAALSGGVQGYLLVDDAPEHLAAAIRSVRHGGRILSPRVASRLAENVAGEALTLREQAVLALVVEGLCNKSVAIRLGITPGTVKSHLRSAFGKLGAASRTHAIAIAHRRGLLEHRPSAPTHDELPAAASRPPLCNLHLLRSLPARASG